jgi:hypothetical protein
MKHKFTFATALENKPKAYILACFFLLSITSCSEQYWPDKENMKQEILDKEENLKYRFCTVNMIWIKPHSNAVGAALMFRDDDGTTLATAMDVMEQEDSVFRFFPEVVCDTSNYRIQYRGASGNLIEDLNVSFADENGEDERIITSETATYYLQLTWKMDTVSKWDVLLGE